MILDQLSVVVFTGHVQHLPEALIDEKILTPETVAVAQLPEVILAGLVAAAPSGDSVLGENLKWTMETVLAVVQVNSVLALVVHTDHLSKPVGEEDSIGIYLHYPIMFQVVSVSHHLVPEGDEDGEVEGGSELTALLALKVAVDLARVETICDLVGAVAEDLVLVALKEADLALVLHGEQLLLIGVREHEGGAKEGGTELLARVLLERGI
mmetsp:Transcript_21015/g.45473  ORF Transcript_21015/g.45473 Transcript_21015/m.45473 type:complete len:210 (-) Transcript_21015:1704-2333(-)